MSHPNDEFHITHQDFRTNFEGKTHYIAPTTSVLTKEEAEEKFGPKATENLISFLPFEGNIFKDLPLQVKIKRLSPEAVIPSYAKSGDAGLDLTTISAENDEFGNIVYHTGLAFKIPDGHLGLLFPRSSNAKKDLWLTNSIGIIDQGFIGEITMKYRPSNNFGNGYYHPGDRIGQLLIIPYPQVELIEVEDLGQTERGTGSYGSTGR